MKKILTIATAVTMMYATAFSASAADPVVPAMETNAIDSSAQFVTGQQRLASMMVGMMGGGVENEALMFAASTSSEGEKYGNEVTARLNNFTASVGDARNRVTQLESENAALRSALTAKTARLEADLANLTDRVGPFRARDNEWGMPRQGTQDTVMGEARLVR